MENREPQEQDPQNEKESRAINSERNGKKFVFDRVEQLELDVVTADLLIHLRTAMSLLLLPRRTPGLRGCGRDSGPAF